VDSSSTTVLESFVGNLKVSGRSLHDVSRANDSHRKSAPIMLCALGANNNFQLGLSTTQVAQPRVVRNVGSTFLFILAEMRESRRFAWRACRNSRHGNVRLLVVCCHQQWRIDGLWVGKWLQIRPRYVLRADAGESFSLSQQAQQLAEGVHS
jgi:hypothetical protein